MYILSRACISPITSDVEPAKLLNLIMGGDVTHCSINWRNAVRPHQKNYYIGEAQKGLKECTDRGPQGGQKTPVRGDGDTSMGEQKPSVKERQATKAS